MFENRSRTSNVSPSDPLRVAIISTPRTGNTWLRHLLSRIWSLPQLAVHEMADDGWKALPRECVLQLHWRKTPEFTERMAAEGFRIITLARHPFDVLISILHVAVYGVESERWLCGLHGDESALWGAMPGSQAFLDYASGPRAAALFQISNEWWQAPGNRSIRYEDLVRDPIATLNALEDFLGPVRGQPIDRAVEETSIPKLRAETGIAQHFWLGRPGLWRELIPAPRAAELAAVLRPTLQAFNYPCDPNPELSSSEADSNWIRYFGHELRLNLNRFAELRRTDIGVMQRRIEESNQAMKDWETRYVGILAEKQIAESQRDAALEELEHHLPLIGEALHRLPMIEGCGRLSLRTARFVQACMNRVAWLRRFGRRSVAQRTPNQDSGDTTSRHLASPIPSHVELSP